jgi:hypothetical protein
MPLKLGTQDVTLKLGSQDVTAYLGAEEVSAFDPTSIEGLALWLDAADGSTLFQNSDGTTPATETSDPVGYWGDKSGNNRHATQATAGNRPTITSIGSRKGLQYAASPATWLTTTGSNLGLSQPYTAFYAIKANASGIGTLFDGSAGSTRAILSGTVNSTTQAWAGTAFQIYGYWKASDIAVGAFRFDGASSSGAVNNKSLSVVDSTVGSNGLSQHINVGAFTNNTAILPGAFGELLLYDGSVSDADAGRVIDYLARKWGITLAPQVSNADAQDWVNRVYANGGTVSESTAAAVNTFCNAIDAASIRDRFYRLNLFAGTGLNAALVPLYRGPTFGGTTYGNATDTNPGAGPFVSGDYSPTVGLVKTGNTSAYLDTGLAIDDLPSAATGHIAAWMGTHTPAAFLIPVGANVSTTDRYWLVSWTTGGDQVVRGYWGGNSPAQTATLGATIAAGLYIANRSGATSLDVYEGGTSIASLASSVTPGAISENFYVAAANDSGTPGAFVTFPLAGYSIGLSLTQPQAAAYDAAYTALISALGRPLV